MIRFFAGMLSLLLLSASILAVNIVQVLSLLPYPIAPSLTRRINLDCADLWWGFAVFCVEKICGIRLVITGDKRFHKENALVIANHQQMPDILVILCLAKRAKMLKHCKWFVKDPLKYVPGIGWGMLFLDCVFLKRRWADDAAGIQRTFEKFRTRKIPFWMISFPEGTRSTEVKRERSRGYARKKGLREFKHLMLPRTKGFLAACEGLDGLYGSVIDITIAFEPRVPGVFEFFYNSDFKKAHVHVHRTESLPAGKEGKEKWLLDRFTEKDGMLEHFHKNGRLP